VPALKPPPIEALWVDLNPAAPRSEWVDRGRALEVQARFGAAGDSYARGFVETKDPGVAFHAARASEQAGDVAQAVEFYMHALATAEPGASEPRETE
jgi:hypothetical protein